MLGAFAETSGDDAAAVTTGSGSDDLRFDWDFGDGSSTSPWWQWAMGAFGDTSTDPLPSPQVGPAGPTSTVSHAWARACLYGISTQVGDDDGVKTATNYGAVAVQRAAGGSAPRNFAQWRAAIQNGELGQADLDCYLDVARHLSSVLLGRSELDDASPGGDPTPWSARNGSVDATARNGAGVPSVLDDPPGGPAGDKLAQEQLKFDRALLAIWLSYADGAFGWDQVVDGGQAFHAAVAEMEAIRRNRAAPW